MYLDTIYTSYQATVREAVTYWSAVALNFVSKSSEKEIIELLYLKRRISSRQTCIVTPLLILKEQNRTILKKLAEIEPRFNHKERIPALNP